jgi:hypothetical protein
MEIFFLSVQGNIGKDLKKDKKRRQGEETRRVGGTNRMNG